jgi:aminopeptidase N
MGRPDTLKNSHGQSIRLKDYRKPPYMVKTVDLTFKLEPHATRVVSRLKVERAKETPAGAALVLDGDGLQLSGLSINGKPAGAKDYLARPDRLVLNAVPRARAFTLEIETVINPSANTKLMGLYRSGGNYCTQCEAEGFRRITYFPDRPDVLAVYTTRIEGSEASEPVLLGNGNCIETGRLGNGRHFAVWHDPHPKPAYLFALVAGSLDSIHADYVTASGRQVKLGIYVERGKTGRAGYAMDALIRSMRWDEKAFGREYDLDVFNIVAVPDFNMGAMENKGLNVFNDKYVLADPQTATDADYQGIERVIAHEYFHNWTGNRITCRDWFQLCLKEGLTVYRDQEFCADERSRPVQRIGQVRTLRAAQFPEDAGPLAHPVRPESYREINNFYTTTIYEKGAELVRMIATIIGRKNFRKGMDLYFRRHDGEAATIEDFVKCFEDAAKADLSQFMLWYSQAGTPVIPVSAEYDRDKQRLTLSIEQTLAATPGQARKRPMQIPLRTALINSDGQVITPAKITGAEVSADVIHLKNRSQKVVFHGVASRPTVSINRDFSAPVILEFTQTKADLLQLAASDNDAFNRWQAFQEYGMRLLISATRALSRGKAPKWDSRFVEIAATIAGNCDLEPAYRSMTLSLPGEGEIAQALGRNVDPDAIYRARLALMAQMGEALEPVRLSMASELATGGSFSPDADAAGKRSLNNLLLTYGVVANSAAAESESLAQFETAGNMNDRFAAFSRILHHHASRSASAQAIAKFEARHGDDPLVMDKWFAVQAAAPGKDAAKRIRALMRHKGFSLRNPNRVRSVIGAFASANLTGFNAPDGTGHLLVADSIREIDAINPQVAARMLTAFRSFRLLEPVRRKSAEAALTTLKAGGRLSRDTADILDRTLAKG